MTAERPLIDPARHWSMSPRYRIAECVNHLGEASYWILDTEGPSEVTVQIPTHERLGKLPRDIRDRLGLLCGAQTHSGAPCRARVNAFGTHCPRHSSKPAQGSLPLEEQQEMNP
ncbi:hypothetical protein RBS60_10950 [Sinomonas sp. ASV486]|uniref:hypothetical protein n=1 Tax=Sinomonas sp. ASV486 TaxID=3051170 RepID=UPI0027DD4264|nr:hypothetical protein [Sinomonas sp. ASV486]MDQ4490715.1 hypothetical protein [Sinomonas sp. ASV486]